uniref:tRNA(His) guanylyltransferase n=1 Tax=Oryza sativa subsp. japonica TaxID=39947 RepID=Q75KT6_ORYSJ|nr:putative tRNAHis guanylyltransferase [Oryza sativa Japonica Group]
MKWKDFFPNKELKEPPYFDGRVVCYPNLKTIRDYLAWRQVDCHINNQYNTCFWSLVKSGKTEKEAQQALKGTFSKDKNELLSQQFQINYDDEPAIFRKGSCVYRDKVETMVKTDRCGNPIKRTRLVITNANVDIIGPEFWENHPYILREALRLMNASASLMMESFPDIVFGYGFSNEYSFVFQDKTELYQRQESLILSSCTSRFTLFYMMKWKDFFPNKDLVEPPHFEAELLCYPKQKILCDYLSSRQAECHTTNQYSTCFWMLVKSGKSENEAREILKGTLSKDKNELLFQQFHLNYNNEPAVFRKGSCTYRQKVEESADAEGRENTTRERVVYALSTLVEKWLASLHWPFISFISFMCKTCAPKMQFQLTELRIVMIYLYLAEWKIRLKQRRGTPVW